MSAGEKTPNTRPVAWVYLRRDRHQGHTICWWRGDPVAYVLTGKRIGEYGMTEMLATIAVLPAGWTDLAEIRSLGERWLSQRFAGG